MVQITSVEQAIENNGNKILAFGDSGAGKTRLILTLLDWEKAITGQYPEDLQILIISAEAGLLSIKQEMKDYPLLARHYQVATVNSVDDLDEILTWLKMPHPFVWVVLDSISEIAEVCLSEEKKLSKDGRKAYGNLQTRISDLLREFRDLPNVHIYMSAKEEMQEVAEGQKRFSPSMPGRALTRDVNYMFDEVFELRWHETGENAWNALQTSSDVKYRCKDRSGKLNPIEEPNLYKILCKMGFSIEQQQEQQEQEHKEESETPAEEQEAYFP